MVMGRCDQTTSSRQVETKNLRKKTAVIKNEWGMTLKRTWNLRLIKCLMIWLLSKSSPESVARIR